MTRTVPVLAKRLLRHAPLIVLALSVLFITRCQVPAGCGPGLTITSPYVGTLVDYTDPPSGMIMPRDSFTQLTIFFFTPVDAATFDPAIHVRVFEIEDRWEAVDEGREWTEHEIFGLFSPSFEHTCQTHPVCDPADPRHVDSFASRIVLNVAAPDLLQADKSYRIEILGECSDDPVDPSDCTENPPLSWDGVGLPNNINLVFGLVGPAEEPCLTIRNYPLFNEDHFTPPHKPIEFFFNHPLGFVNFAPNRQEGFNFALQYGGEWLISDSIQGLLPGTRYQVDFLSSDLAPAGGPPGIAYTMDRRGNALRPWNTAYDCTETEDETISVAFKTSHVRILVPLHEPFSTGADNWGAQLEDLGYDEHFILVEITDQVDRLTAVGDVVFDDWTPTPEEVNDENGVREKTSVIRIDVDPADLTTCDPDDPRYPFEDQILSIVAWSEVPGGGWESLGRDELVVNPIGPSYDFGFPENYEYINNYPEDNDGGYKNELNGVAHDENHWYFSKNEGARLLKIPVGLDLSRDWYDEDLTLGLYTLLIEETEIGNLGYNHFGDIDARDGFIYVPISGGSDLMPAIAVFYSNPDVEYITPEAGDFEWVGYGILSAQEGTGWCAIREDESGLTIFSSDSVISETKPIRKYAISIEYSPGSTDGGTVTIDYIGDMHLQPGTSEWNQFPDYDGTWEFHHMQGGVFSEGGHLYLVNGIHQYFDNKKGGIWVFDVNNDVATLVEHSSQDGIFEFEYHPYNVPCGVYCECSNEPEGIDIWDLDSGIAPGISGQIHVIMIDNYGIGGDDLYFKHYTTTPGDICKI